MRQEGGTRRERPGTGQRELLREWDGPEQLWIGTTGAAGLATQEDENINERSMIVGYVSEYRSFYRGEVGTIDRGWYVRFVLERTASVMVRTWAWNPTCVECTSPIWTW